MNQHSNRPLSPHLQVYKPQITSIGSIMHRISGVLLSVFTLLWVVWLLSLNQSPAGYDKLQSILHSWPGKLVSVIAIWALFYHLMTGTRHLIWDSLYMLELDAVKRSGWTIVGLSLLTTLIAAGVWL